MGFREASFRQPCKLSARSTDPPCSVLASSMGAPLLSPSCRAALAARRRSTGSVGPLWVMYETETDAKNACATAASSCMGKPPASTTSIYNQTSRFAWLQATTKRQIRCACTTHLRNVNLHNCWGKRGGQNLCCSDDEALLALLLVMFAPPLNPRVHVYTR